VGTGPAASIRCRAVGAGRKVVGARHLVAAGLPSVCSSLLGQIDDGLVLLCIFQLAKEVGRPRIELPDIPELARESERRAERAEQSSSGEKVL
jgi:hypothetical protein